MTKAYDALIIGAGHNGLVCAFYLAKAGLKVRIVEARDVVGHILYGNELKLWTLPWKLARFGFSSDRSGSHYSIARAEGRTPQQLAD